jgi:hypothetical protein
MTVLSNAINYADSAVSALSPKNEGLAPTSPYSGPETPLVAPMTVLGNAINHADSAVSELAPKNEGLAPTSWPYEELAGENFLHSII